MTDSYAPFVSLSVTLSSFLGKGVLHYVMNYSIRNVLVEKGIIVFNAELNFLTKVSIIYTHGI